MNERILDMMNGNGVRFVGVQKQKGRIYWSFAPHFGEEPGRVIRLMKASLNENAPRNDEAASIDQRFRPPSLINNGREASIFSADEWDK